MASNAENVSIWWRHHVLVAGTVLTESLSNKDCIFIFLGDRISADIRYTVYAMALVTGAYDWGSLFTYYLVAPPEEQMDILHALGQTNDVWQLRRWVELAHRIHDAIIMSLWRQNDVATSFWRNNDVIIAPCARWEERKCMLESLHHSIFIIVTVNRIVSSLSLSPPSAPLLSFS